MDKPLESNKEGKKDVYKMGLLSHRTDSYTAQGNSAFNNPPVSVQQKNKHKWNRKNKECTREEKSWDLCSSSMCKCCAKHSAKRRKLRASSRRLCRSRVFWCWLKFKNPRYETRRNRTSFLGLKSKGLGMEVLGGALQWLSHAFLIHTWKARCKGPCP